VLYPELRRRLELSDTSPSPPLAEVREAVLELRRGKSMVIDPEIADPGDPNRRSAGSFFVNPIVPPDVAAGVVRRAKQLGTEEPPSWPVADGRTKFSAAWLIERSGFVKGYRKGEAGVSSRHALALVNLGQARAADLMSLAAEIRTGVYSSFGVELEPEPVLLGFS
jgi:UDP-N-acetylmuramate dehydrogenase